MLDYLHNTIKSPAKTLRAFCLFFMLAAAVASIFELPNNIVLVAFAGIFLSVTGVIMFMNTKSVRFVLILLLAMSFGVWRLGVSEPDCSSVNNVCSKIFKTVEVVGVVTAEPGVRAKDIQYYIQPKLLNGSELVSGEILMYGGLTPIYNYGTTLQFKCKLMGPFNTPGSTFRYDKYLASHGVQAICRAPSKVEIVSRSSWLSLVGELLELKSGLSKQVGRLWAEPEASLMTGLLYGARSTLPQVTQDQFSLAGVSHIVAVSGFNVSVIAAALYAIMARLGVRRNRAVWLALIFIWLFVVFAGASAAAVRAGIMASVVILAERLGRLASPGAALLFAATIMTALNPFILLWDIGFQLSFGATIGLVYGTESFEKMLERIRVFKQIPVVSEALATTLAASVATLPLLLYYFGRISVMSLLANVLIVPLVPWLMLAGVVAIVPSFIFLPLGQLIAWVAHLGLWYILAVVKILGQTGPWVATVAVPWYGVLGWYIYLMLYVENQD